MKKIGPMLRAAMGKMGRGTFLAIAIFVAMLLSDAGAQEEELPVDPTADRDATHVLNVAREEPAKLVNFLKANLPDAEWGVLVNACAPGDSEMLRRAKNLAEYAERAGFDAETQAIVQAKLKKWRKRIPVNAGGTLVGYTADAKAVYRGADAADSEAADTWVYVPSEKPTLEYAGTRGDTAAPTPEEQEAALEALEAAETIPAALKSRYQAAEDVAEARVAAAKEPVGEAVVVDGGAQ